MYLSTKMIFFALVCLLIIHINYVGAQCYNGGCSQSAIQQQEARQQVLQQELDKARITTLSNQVDQLEEQHTNDSQMMILLISIIIGLASAVTALIVIFLKIRKWNKKPRPETEHKEGQ